MRRFLLLIITLLLSTLILTPINISAQEWDPGISFENDEWFFDMENVHTIKMTYPEERMIELHKMFNKPLQETVFCLHPMRPADADAGYKKFTDVAPISWNKDYTQPQSIELAKIVTAYKMLEPDHTKIMETTEYYAAAAYLIYSTLYYDFKNEVKYVFDPSDPESTYSEYADEVKQMQDVIATLNFAPVAPRFEVTSTYKVGDVVTIEDLNDVLHEDDHSVVSTSEGIEDVKIEDGKLTFTITDDTPNEKEITIDANAQDEVLTMYYGDLYSATASQSIYMYKDTLPIIHEGATLKITVDDQLGSLKIVKVDEKGDMILDTVIFDIHKAILQDDGSYLMDETVYMTVEVKGETLVNIEIGDYYLVEKATSHRYIIDDTPILVKVEKGKTNTITHTNKSRDISVNITKKDQDENYYINDTHFALYRSNGDKEIYFARRNKNIDLKEVFDLQDDEMMIANGEGYSLLNNTLVGAKNAHLSLYAVTKEVPTGISLIGFDTYIHDEGDIIPFKDISVKKGTIGITSDLKYIGINDRKLQYLLQDGDDRYLIVRNMIDDDIESHIAPRPNDYSIYKIRSIYDLYIVNEDSAIISGDFGSVKVELIEEDITEDKGNVSFSGLKDSDDYMICETKPSEGYEYGDQEPCIIFDPDDLKETNYQNITIYNKIKDVKIELYKTNTTKDILLNGAGFDVYKTKGGLDHQVAINDDIKDDEEYIGHYISGHMHVDLDEFTDKKGNYRIEVYQDDELIIQKRINDEVNIGGLKDGTYTVKLRDLDSNELYGHSLSKSVRKGMILIDDLKYDDKVILKETDAPIGYHLDERSFTLTFDDGVINGRLPYYRINEMIIIPPEKEVIRKQKIVIVKTMAK